MPEHSVRTELDQDVIDLDKEAAARSQRRLRSEAPNSAERDKRLLRHLKREFSASEGDIRAILEQGAEREPGGRIATRYERMLTPVEEQQQGAAR